MCSVLIGVITNFTFCSRFYALYCDCAIIGRLCVDGRVAPYFITT